MPKFSQRNKYGFLSLTNISIAENDLIDWDEGLDLDRVNFIKFMLNINQSQS
jgi:hypothetical protein